MSIESRIKEIVDEQLGLDGMEIRNDNTFEELGADSLDLVETLMAIEEEYDIDIPDEQFYSMEIVQNVIDYVVEHT